MTTRAPTSDWLAQRLRELTPFGQGPKFLLRDNDTKFGRAFNAVAQGAGIRVLRSPILAPKANSHVERLVGSIRRECLDHVLVLNEPHLQSVLDEYRTFFNEARPRQGIGQRRPSTAGIAALTQVPANLNPLVVISRPVLGGLHHDYKLAA